MAAGAPPLLLCSAAGAGAAPRRAHRGEPGQRRRRLHSVLSGGGSTRISAAARLGSRRRLILGAGASLRDRRIEYIDRGEPRWLFFCYVRGRDENTEEKNQRKKPDENSGTKTKPETKTRPVRSRDWESLADAR